MEDKVRARVTVVDENGNEFEGEVSLSPVRRGARRQTKSLTRAKDSVSAFDFDMNERAFVKRYAGGMSGPKKFALLLAYLVKGRCEKDILLKEVEKCWNKMTALLGGKFNRKYSNKAREYGWADTRKRGVYVLRANWLEIFAGNEGK